MASTPRQSGDQGNLTKLRRTRVALAICAVLFGAVGAWTAQQRYDGAHDALAHSGPLTNQTQKLYHALSDADATAATAYLSNGLEPAALRDEYTNDLVAATTALTTATAEADGEADTAKNFTTVATQLPVYAGYIEAARANNLQGFPVGVRYLDKASGLMQQTILPAAQALDSTESQNLLNAEHKSIAVPFIWIGAAVVLLGALIMIQLREKQRTNRLLNAGLVGATACAVLSAVWLIGAGALESGEVSQAKATGSNQTTVLARAQIESLQARSDEMLTLVARGGAPADEVAYLKVEPTLASDLSDAAQLASASADGTAADSGASQSQAVADQANWEKAHVALRASDDGNDYASAVDNATNGAADKAFSALQTDLDNSIASTQAALQSHSQKAENDLVGLEIGLAVLGLAMAAGVVAGLGRRISEYR